MRCVTVRSAEDMASLLHDVSPGAAADFARARHEGMCAQGDEAQEAFWRRVTKMLARPSVRGVPQGVVRLARG